MSNKISGFTFIKNGVSLGYPFVETVLSMLPIVDEFVILECFSEDSTYYWCKRLEKQHPKVKVYRQEWAPITNTGTSIGTMQTAALRKCTGDYSLCCQADELWHESSIRTFGKLVRSAAANSYAFDFQHIGRNYQEILPRHTAAYTRAIRCVKNMESIKSEHDGWTFEGDINPSVYVPLPHPIFHLGYEFPVNRIRKYINHAKLYPDLEDYQRIAAAAKLEMEKAEFGEIYDKHKSPFPLPRIIEDMVGVKEYFVRESLFTNPGHYVNGL